MAQAQAICGSSILACGLRVTLLNDDGSVADGPNNFYVTRSLISLAINPNVEEGAERTLVSGCDCIIATAKFPNLLKRFDFEINLGALEPGLLSMMTGGAVILDSSTSPVPIGFDWPVQVSCSDQTPPLVALEVWSDNWDTGAPSATLPYFHWVWPATQWQIGPSVLNTDYAPIVLNGQSLGNSQWGHGPYGDDPGQVVGYLGSVWQSADAIPEAVCGYQTVTPSS